MKLAPKISLAFFITALLLSSIAASIFYVIAKDSLQKTIYSNLSSTLTARTNHIETCLEMFKISVAQLSESTILESLLKIRGKEDPEYKNTFDAAMLRMKRTKQANPAVNEFLLIDKDGKVVASTNENSIGQDKSGDVIFLGAQKGIYLKDVCFSESFKEPLMAVSAPVVDSHTGEFQGVLAARVTLNQLNEIVTEKTGLGDTGEIYIINKYGYIVTSSRFNKTAILQQKVDTQNVRAARRHKGREHVLSQKEMMHIFPDYRGIQVLGTHEYIPQMQWGVLAEIDIHEAFLPLAKIRLVVWGIIFIVPLAAWLLGLLIARFITEPLHKLHKGTEIIGKGNFDYKVATAAKDEVGQLSRAFDAMTENLKATTASVEKLNEEIAERKKAESRAQGMLNHLQESEKRFMDVLYSSRDAILLICENKFVDCNEATARMLGYASRKEFLMTHPSELSPPIQPDGRTSIEKADAMMKIASKQGFHRFEWMHRRANGEDFPVEVSLTPVSFQGKTVLHCMWIDLTKQKQDEKQLKESQEQLKKQAAQLDNALNEELKSRKIMISMLEDNNLIRDKLEKQLKELEVTQAMLVQSEKMSAVGQLSSGIAHEIKNPLAVILLAIDSLGGLAEIDQKLKTKVDMMRRAAERANEVVIKLLNFAHVSSSEEKIVNLHERLDTVCVLVNNIAKLKDIRLVREYSAENLTLRGDPVLLEQVFMNIISNAVDAISFGGMVTIRTESRSDMPEKEKSAVIEIADNGTGIAPEVLSKIFDPFFTTKAPGKGTGLGLSMALSIIEHHQGKVSVDSQVGRGTKFTISFPWVEDLG